MHPRRLFIASCIALITSAFSFMIRADISDPLAESFLLTKESVGAAMAAAFLGMAIAMLVVAPLCDILGMKKVLIMAWLCHLTGILGTLFAHELTTKLAPSLVPSALETNGKLAEWILWTATFLVGCGNGLVEIAINPLAATLYPRDKTKYMNILHAWWPGGLIISGLIAWFVIGKEPINGIDAWKIKMGILLIPLFIYGVMIIGEKFPETERVQMNVSTGEMFAQALRPMFLIWSFCMLLTASTELAPNQWLESVLTRTAGVSGTLVFVYTSGLMFVLRFFAGPMAHKLSPVGMLTVSAILSAAGLYWLSYVNAPVMAFVAATVFGVGVTYFWPTMLGVTAERFPKGGALLLGLMGCFGNVAIFFVLPQMGAIYDSYTVHSLTTELQKAEVPGPKGEPLSLVLSDDKKSWVPKPVADQIYPAGTKKVNPEARKILGDAKTLVNNVESKKITDKDYKPEQLAQAKSLLKANDVAAIERAEATGAAWSFRWVTVLPGILIVIFGLIALGDKARGGYKAVHLTDQAATGAPIPLSSPPT